MSDVFERLYNSPTKASLGQQTQKFESPTKGGPAWKGPNYFSSDYEELPPIKKSPHKQHHHVKGTTTPEPPPAAVPRESVLMDITVPPKQECMEIFDSIDMNGNGILSLAELDKAIVEVWPQLDNKPAIMRAYKAADGDANGFIKRDEFCFFLKYISYYNNLWHVFETTDVDGDRRLTRDEFLAVAPRLKLKQNPEQFFDEMDANHGGLVLFDEFCAKMARDGTVPKETKKSKKATSKQKAGSESSNHHKDIPLVAVEEEDDHLPPPAPAQVMQIDVPAEEECMKVFDSIDYNGNRILSLAEIDKAVVEVWPDMNNKPAIMRAYKASDRDGNGFIKREEFVFFLKYLSYYNNFWQEFESIDENGDRRISKEEFVAVAPKLHVSNPEGVFAEMDKNKGGYVLFDEFCGHMAKGSNDSSAKEE